MSRQDVDLVMDAFGVAAGVEFDVAVLIGDPE